MPGCLVIHDFDIPPKYCRFCGEKFEPQQYFKTEWVKDFGTIDFKIENFD
jgi:hypothetical protein